MSKVCTKPVALEEVGKHKVSVRVFGVFLFVCLLVLFFGHMVWLAGS